MRLIQWARKDGKIVHISQAERGAACQCVCDACGAPLIARQGSKNAHSFAHSNSDCHGNQETLLHLRAKEIIQESKRLMVKGENGNQEVCFDMVDVEQQVGPFRADVVCIKNDRKCYVEIAVTHRCSQEKIQYFKENELAVVEIMIDGRREFGSIDEYAEFVISGAPRKWISNPLSKVKSEPQILTVDHEKIREMQERHDRVELHFLEQLRKAVGDRPNQLHYGELVKFDLRRFGIPYKSSLCVQSRELPDEYGNLAMVSWHHKELRKYLGRQVGFDVIYDYDKSLVLNADNLFPQVIIRLVEGVDEWDLAKEIGTPGWRRRAYSWI